MRPNYHILIVDRLEDVSIPPFGVLPKPLRLDIIVPSKQTDKGIIILKVSS